MSAWDPGYADSGEGAIEASKAKLDVELERAAKDWAPISPPTTQPTPPRVFLVDGVRRLDARVDIAVDDQAPAPGLCASYAAGVVACDLGGSAPQARLEATHVERGLFSPVPEAGLSAGRVASYEARHVSANEPGDLINAVQDRLSTIEVDVAALADPSHDDLLVIDGALRRRTHLPRAVGYIKSHQRRYLPDHLSFVVDQLAAGQRSPVFGLGTSWQRHTWYLRLPGGGDGAWAGIARLEATADLHIDMVIALANASAAVLPQMASSPHKDPRAPQNLTPIAGLERRLRNKLGDARLLLRNLRSQTGLH